MSPLNWDVLGNRFKACIKLPNSTDPQNTKLLTSVDEANLDLSKFWKTFRNEHRKRLGNFQFTKEDTAIHVRAWLYDLSQVHLDELKEQRHLVQLRMDQSQNFTIESKRDSRKDKGKENSDIAAKMASLNLQATTLGTTQTIWGSTPDSYTKLAEPTTKKKTRGQGNAGSVGDGGQLEPGPIAPVPMKRIFVKKTILDTLLPFFPRDDTEARSVYWEDLRKGMQDLGIGSTRFQDGHFSFLPDDTSPWAGLKKMGLHRPHPEPVFDHGDVKFVGGRLQRWLEWSKEMFVLKE
ncbi:hypothetical protein IFR05_009727 [Cadophora sp. M221]|nr:hypothetical protein IFR05_009727 [Cadophora sp. M221]